MAEGRNVYVWNRCQLGSLEGRGNSQRGAKRAERRLAAHFGGAEVGNIKEIYQVCGLEQLGNSCRRVDQSDAATRLLRAHLKSSEYSQRAAVNVCAFGEIQNDGLYSSSSLLKNAPL